MHLTKWNTKVTNNSNYRTYSIKKLQCIHNERNSYENKRIYKFEMVVV